MRVEYHNAHGSQLVLSLTQSEAEDMLRRLLKATLMTPSDTGAGHYVDFKCYFENDNDHYSVTTLSMLVEGEPSAGCQPAFPCGKRVEQRGVIPAGPCDLQQGHEPGCTRYTVAPQG